MLEGVFHKGDEQQWRNHHLWQLAWQVHIDLHIVGIANAHQVHIVADEVDLALQRHQRFVALVKQIAHQLRQHLNGMLGLFGVDVDQGMYVVERVHEEMGAHLILQILQLLLQVFAFERLHALTNTCRSVEILRGDVQSQEQHHDDKAHRFAFTEDKRASQATRMGTAHGAPRILGAFHRMAFLDGSHLVGPSPTLLVHVPFRTGLEGMDGACGAEIQLEARQSHHHDDAVKPFAPTVDKQGRYQEVVDDEVNSKHRQHPPRHTHAKPVVG